MAKETKLSGEMLADKVKLLHQQYHTPNYAPEHVFVKGKGSWLWEADGTKYLDFVSGIAVTALGHSHPAITKAISKQAGTLMHVSNLYHNDQAPFLAEMLCKRSIAEKLYFCNSGAEANEGLIKLARKWGSESGRYRVITFRSSFHGRTLATLTATGQDKVQKGFAPLPDGFDYAEYNDIESVKAQLKPQTAAVMLELVQAEGGVRPADKAFIQQLNQFCQENKLLLLVDEIQTGVGRTGSLFAYEQFGIEPDAISLAKGLGGGFPIGAVLCGARLSETFSAGSHGTTFGGQPLACCTARTVLEQIEHRNLLENVTQRGEQLRAGLEKIVNKYAFVTEVRGMGLIQGLQIDRPAKKLETLITRRGLLTVCTAGDVIRLLPPLNVKAGEIKLALKTIDKACTDWQADPS